MKKILSLLTAITLTASGTSSIISCSTKNDPNENNQKQANTIATSLDKQSISFMQQGIKTKAKDYIQTILSALKTKKLVLIILLLQQQQMLTKLYQK